MLDSNGHQPQGETRQVRLPANKLSRLNKMYLRVEGADAAAQGAQQVAQNLRQALQQSLGEACEDEGFLVPDGSTGQVQSIDWATGLVTIALPEQPVAAPALSPPPLTEVAEPT